MNTSVRLGGNTNIKNQTFFSPQDLPGSNMGDTESLDVCADSSSNETTNCHNLNFYCHTKIINNHKSYIQETLNLLTCVDSSTNSKKKSVTYHMSKAKNT